jgi:hypothetical protein
VLTAIVFLLEIVPLELQRRIVNDLAKDRHFRSVTLLCTVYAGTVLVQGGTIAIQMIQVPSSQGGTYRRAFRELTYSALTGVEGR